MPSSDVEASLDDVESLDDVPAELLSDWACTRDDWTSEPIIWKAVATSAALRLDEDADEDEELVDESEEVEEDSAEAIDVSVEALLAPRPLSAASKACS